MQTQRAVAREVAGGDRKLIADILDHYDLGDRLGWVNIDLENWLEKIGVDTYAVDYVFNGKPHTSIAIYFTQWLQLDHHVAALLKKQHTEN